MSRKPGRPSAVKPGLAGIHEFVDDFATPLLCAHGSHLILLNQDRVLLPILRRMSVVRDRTKRKVRLLNIFVLTFPPVSHVCVSG